MFRLIKIVVVIAVLAGLAKWYPQYHAKHEIERIVRERSAQLPMQIAPGVNLVNIEFSNQVLRHTIEFTDKIDFGLRKPQLEQTMLAEYCGGKLKPFVDLGVTAEYVVNYHTELGLPKTATITLPPQKCGSTGA